MNIVILFVHVHVQGTSYMYMYIHNVMGNQLGVFSLLSSVGCLAPCRCSIMTAKAVLAN